MDGTNFKLSTTAAVKAAARMLLTCTQAHKQQQPENSWSCYELLLLLLDITGCTPALGFYTLCRVFMVTRVTSHVPGRFSFYRAHLRSWTVSAS